MAKNPLSRRQFIHLGTGASPPPRSPKISCSLTCFPRPLVRSRPATPFASLPSAPAFADANTSKLRSAFPAFSASRSATCTTAATSPRRKSVKNPSVPATRDYRTILDRKDVDSVLIATMDHQHRHIFEDACAAGKDVYCEKPMSHTVEDGFAMVEAAHKHGRMIAVGSQRVSSVLYAKAKEIYDSGKLGEVFSINAYWDRNSPSGAWVYPIPPDASEQTIDWNTFLGTAPKRPFDPVRFFRWRCFTDYGEGLGGDLFVHLLSGHSLHHRHQRARPARRSPAEDCSTSKMAASSPT